MTNDEDEAAARLDTCLVNLGETMINLAGSRMLDRAQRRAVQSTVAALLGRPGELADEFVRRFDADGRAAYDAIRGAFPDAATTGERERAADGEPPSGDAADRMLVRSAGERVPLLDETAYYFGLVKLTTANGAESEAHLERTAGYARALAEVLDCDAPFVDNLAYATWLHDIGLVAVPEPILTRRGRVDAYERTLIDTHTKVGAYLVNSVSDLLRCDSGPLANAVDITLYHHERYDGLGPLGLAGNRIPYAARIVAFADVYDTLRRRRPYREQLDHAAAVEAIRASNSGDALQFDPALMPAFLHVADHFDAIYRACPDDG